MAGEQLPSLLPTGRMNLNQGTFFMAYRLSECPLHEILGTRSVLDFGVFAYHKMQMRPSQVLTHESHIPYAP
jgi:hypothetical protein